MTVAAGLAGCGSSDTATLAVVGDDKITVAEFERLIPATQRVFQSAQDEYDKKRLLLDSVVVTRLLVQAAREKGIDKLPSIAEAVAANRNQFLVEAMYQNEIASKVSATDAEVRDYYNKLEFLLRGWRIAVPSEDTAKMLFERLKAGEDFGQLAYEYSVDPSAKHSRGDLGYFSYGSGDPTLEAVAFQMEPGEISPPIKGESVWHILKITEKTPNQNRKSFQEMRPTIETNILRVKQYRLIEDFYAGLEVAYPVKIDTAVADYLMLKRADLYPPQVLPNIPKNDFDESLLDRNERELVLATWEGGSITLMQYLVQARRMLQANQRANFDDYAGLAMSARQLVIREMLTREAERRKVDKTDEFKWRVRMFEEYSMADVMRDSIPKPALPTEEEIRAYFLGHREEFVVPARIHIYEILLSDEMQARRLAKEIKTLQQFRERAEQLTERSGFRAKRGDMGYIERDWAPELFDAAWAVKDSTVGGPVSLQGRFYALVFPVDRVEKQYGEYFETNKTIRDNLHKTAREAAFRQWVEERRGVTRVEIHEDVLWETIDKLSYADAGDETRK
jgi:parvulin-like peptidyl-prolyl isomerase